MSSLLPYTMFQDVLFPSDESSSAQADGGLRLQKLLYFKPAAKTALRSVPLVIFDFETTGLDASSDRIVEVGALKILAGQQIGEFHSMVLPEIPLSTQAARITGITQDMLVGAPRLSEVMPTFLKFIEGAILVAHNADFDWAFLHNGALRLGYQLAWPCFCTLKIARVLLPQLESRNLDSLAKHYGLEFEARHRSVGDCRVTWGVLARLLADSGDKLRTWQDILPYASGQS